MGGVESEKGHSGEYSKVHQTFQHLFFELYKARGYETASAEALTQSSSLVVVVPDKFVSGGQGAVAHIGITTLTHQPGVHRVSATACYDENDKIPKHVISAFIDEWNRSE